jgi:hypothetical protein
VEITLALGTLEQDEALSLQESSGPPHVLKVDSTVSNCVLVLQVEKTTVLGLPPEGTVTLYHTLGLAAVSKHEDEPSGVAATTVPRYVPLVESVVADAQLSLAG